MLHDGQGVEGKKKQLLTQCFCNENKNAKNDKTHILGGSGQLFADFPWSWYLTPAKSEE
jgi:hypothetical protein